MPKIEIVTLQRLPNCGEQLASMDVILRGAVPGGLVLRRFPVFVDALAGARVGLPLVLGVAPGARFEAFGFDTEARNHGFREQLRDVLKATAPDLFELLGRVR